MRFLSECVPCCGSSIYRSMSTSLPESAVQEDKSIEVSLNPDRKRVRRRISRSMSSVDWRPSLTAIHEEDLVTEEEEKKQAISVSNEEMNKKKKKSSISVAKLNTRSYSFDVNDYRRRSFSSMSSGFATPFMI